MRIKVSIISASWNRAGLLDRALSTYSRQTLPPSEWEYLLVDDASTDNTRRVVARWQEKGLPVRVFDAATDLLKPKQPGQWRDGCALRNAVSQYANGEVIVGTHPEIMVPPDALERAHAAVAADPESWHTAIPYWLPPYDYDLIGWESDLNLLRNAPGFYDDTPPPNPAIDYRNRTQENRAEGEWSSEVWWAMDTHLWRWMGGFREFDVWGPVDIDFAERRHALSIPNKLIRSGRSPAPNGVLMVYHQFHDESPRSMDACMEALSKVERYDPQNKQRVRELGGLYHSYFGGPRERATPGRPVMRDHLARYEWAGWFTSRCGDLVVEVGCGTGYGTRALSCRYIGHDIDAESVAWANTHYGDGQTAFVQADATALPLPDTCASCVVCFEVLEHLPPDAQRKAVAEMSRVLKPGGRFFASTPQKGATPGTPFDRFMLTPMELTVLFRDAGFPALGWHFQHCYGNGEDGNPVLPGFPPDKAEIMCLTGVKP